jgi:hypothetical protein
LRSFQINRINDRLTLILPIAMGREYRRMKIPGFAAEMPGQKNPRKDQTSQPGKRLLPEGAQADSDSKKAG